MEDVAIFIMLGGFLVSIISSVAVIAFSYGRLMQKLDSFIAVHNNVHKHHDEDHVREGKEADRRFVRLEGAQITREGERS